MKKLFVGNLSWKTTEDNLKSLFEKCGGVASVRIIVDQYTGKSKGFGFVEMDSAEAAQKAIQELNEKPFMERNIRVSQALERAERSGNSRDFGGGDEGYAQKSYRGAGGGRQDSRDSRGGDRDSRRKF